MYIAGIGIVLCALVHDRVTHSYFSIFLMSSDSATSKYDLPSGVLPDLSAPCTVES